MVDALVRPGSSRSRVIEAAILAYVTQRQRALRDARELETLNLVADELNREMADVLAYQVEP